MDEDQEQEGGQDGDRGRVKIGLPIILFGFALAVTMDLIGLIPGADDIEEVPALASLAVQWIFGLSNVVLVMQAIVDVIKAIPLVQELPLWTIGWGGACWIQNSDSQLAKAVETAVTIEAKVEGKASEEPANVPGGGGVAAPAAAEEKVRTPISHESAPPPPATGQVSVPAEAPAPEAPDTSERGNKQEEEDVSQSEAERPPEEVVRQKLFGAENVIPFPRRENPDKNGDQRMGEAA